MDTLSLYTRDLRQLSESWPSLGGSVPPAPMLCAQHEGVWAQTPIDSHVRSVSTTGASCLDHGHAPLRDEPLGSGVGTSAPLLAPVDLVPRLRILDGLHRVGGRRQLAVVVQPGRSPGQDFGACLRREGAESCAMWKKAVACGQMQAPCAGPAGDRWPAGASACLWQMCEGAQRLLKIPHCLPVCRPRRRLLPRLPGSMPGPWPTPRPAGHGGRAVPPVPLAWCRRAPPGLRRCGVERARPLLEEAAYATSWVSACLKV